MTQAGTAGINVCKGTFSFIIARAGMNPKRWLAGLPC